MAKGKVTIPYKAFLGYDRGEDGKPVINEEQAKIVRLIYRKFLVEGCTASGIAKYLNAEGVRTPSGKPECKWQNKSVDSILKNEKYKGDALLQKGYIPDFLDHKVVKNNGELDQYYVANHHEPIIEPEQWNLVQAEMERRTRMGAKYSSTDRFASKLICGECGGFYGRKIWHSNSEYRKVVYQCNEKFKKGKKKCCNPKIDEDEIKQKFLIAYNKVMGDKERIISDTQQIINLLTDTSSIDLQIEEAEVERNAASEFANRLLESNKKRLQNQREFDKTYNEYRQRYENAKARIIQLKQERLVRKGKKEKMEAFLIQLNESDEVLCEWNDEIWMLMVEYGKVGHDGSVTFKFFNGTEITID